MPNQAVSEQAVSEQATWTDPKPFWQVWQETVGSHSHKLFLSFEVSQTQTAQWSYGEFDRLVGRAANLLRSQGVVRGQAVHLALANSPTFVAIWLAAMKLGAWMVPSDPHGSAAELAVHLQRTQPAIGVCATTRSAVYRQAVQLYEAAAQTQGSAHNSEMPILELSETAQGLNVFDTEEAVAASAETAIVSADISNLDRAGVPFTSGTTGQPKGVEITQANYSFAGKVMAEAAGLQAGHTQLVVLPLFHANAQYYSFASAIWTGASVALMPKFSASRFLAQAKTHRATHASLFAAPMRMILARGAQKIEGLRLEHCWFAQNITDDQHTALSEIFGCQPRQLYGMTETIPAVLSDNLPPTPQSMGKVTPGCALQVQLDDGSEAPDDAVGEIAVSGQVGITLFRGYLDDPETTEASFRDGWFLTGDRATRAETGLHYFVGRQSEILKVAGENVSTVEVEQVLAAHPAVLEASVVGRPDEMRDEVPVGFVVAADTANLPSEASLRSWCEERLSKPKRPQNFVMLDELPRTSVGKIRKFMLLEQASQL